MASDIDQRAGHAAPVTALPVWMYWQGPIPKWIRECQQTVFRHADDVRLLGPDSEILQPLFARLDLDRFCPAHRADVIRAYLISRYGGLWIDSDCVVYRPLGPILDLVREHGFVVSPQFDGHISDAFVGSTAGGAIATAWHETQVEILTGGGEIGWTGLGADALSKAIDLAKQPWFRIEYWVIQPVWWTDPASFFQLREDREHREHLNPHAYTYMLSHSMISGTGRPEAELLRGDSYFNFLLRQSAYHIGTAPLPIAGGVRLGARP